MQQRPSFWDPEVVAATVAAVLPRVLEALGPGTEPAEVQQRLMVAVSWPELPDPFGVDLVGRLLDQGLSWEAAKLEAGRRLAERFGAPQLALVLGELGTDQLAVHRATVARWVAESGVQPLKNLGDRLRFQILGHPEWRQGTVRAVLHDQALYEVHAPELGHRVGGRDCVLVPYEQAA